VSSEICDDHASSDATTKLINAVVNRCIPGCLGGKMVSNSLIADGRGAGEEQMPDTLVVAGFVAALVLPILTVIGGIIALAVPRRR